MINEGTNVVTGGQHAYITKEWDHNGNKCLHFFVSSFYLMYFVFISYVYLYNVLHFILNKSIKENPLPLGIRGAVTSQLCELGK